jgi:hypothetical protein
MSSLVPFPVVNDHGPAPEVPADLRPGLVDGADKEPTRIFSQERTPGSIAFFPGIEQTVIGMDRHRDHIAG